MEANDIGEALLVAVLHVGSVLAALVVVFLAVVIVRLNTMATLLVAFVIGGLLEPMMSDGLGLDGASSWSVFGVYQVAVLGAVGAIRFMASRAIQEPSDSEIRFDGPSRAEVRVRTSRGLGGLAATVFAGGTVWIPLSMVFALGLHFALDRSGAPEFAFVAIASLVWLSAMHQGALLRGLAASAVGLLIGTVGDAFSPGDARFAFGSGDLAKGIPLAVIAVGVLLLADLGFRFGWQRRELPNISLRETLRGFSGSWYPSGWSANDARVSSLVWFASYSGGIVALVLLLDRFSWGLTGWGTPSSVFVNSALVAGALSVVALMGLITAAVGIRYLGRLHTVPRPVVIGVLAPAAMLFLAVNESFFGLVLAVGFGVGGAAMVRAGWPRLPLVAGVLVSSQVEKWANIAFLIRGPTELLTNPILIVGGAVLVAWLIAHQRMGARGSDRPNVTQDPRVSFAMAGLAVAFYLGSFSYSTELARFVRVSSVAALVFIGVQSWHDWRAGRLTLRAMRIDVPRITSPSVVFAGVIVVAVALTWALDVRWGAMAFAGLVPLALSEGRTRFAGAAVSLVLVYGVIYEVDRAFRPLWF